MVEYDELREQASLDLIHECKDGVIPESYKRYLDLERQKTELEKQINMQYETAIKDVNAEIERVCEKIYFLGEEWDDYDFDEGQYYDERTEVRFEGHWSKSKEELQKILDKNYPTNGDSELEEDRPKILERYVSPKRKRQLIKIIRKESADLYEDHHYQESFYDIITSSNHYLSDEDRDRLNEMKSYLESYFGAELIEKVLTVDKARAATKKILFKGDRHWDNPRKDDELTADELKEVQQLRDVIDQSHLLKWDKHRVFGSIVHMYVHSPKRWCHWHQTTKTFSIETFNDINNPWVKSIIINQ